MVSVDIKHHVYLLTYFSNMASKHSEDNMTGKGRQHDNIGLEVKIQKLTGYAV